MNENADSAPSIWTGLGLVPSSLPISPMILPNAADALPSSVDWITSAPSSSGSLAPRTNTPTSPIHENTSCSRSSPVACLTCAVTAAPPSAPANEENSDFAASPTFGTANAAQASPGSSPSSSLPLPPSSAVSVLTAPSGIPVVIVSSAMPSPSACSEPTVGPSLSNGKIDLNCSSCCGGLGILGERRVDDRLGVEVEVAEAVLLEVVDRVLVAVGVGERLAALRHVGGPLERVLGGDDEEVVDEPDGHALGVDLVVDALVRALGVRLVALRA